MTDDNVLIEKQDEWLGSKPGSTIRLTIAIATISAILAIIFYATIEFALGFQSPVGGMLIGIFSGLLASGIISGLSWFAYDSFLPTYRHLHFRPKIDGSWFGYYFDELHPEGFVREYIYIKQVADKISGTITSSGGRVYNFVGQITVETLVLTWKSHEQNRNLTGAIVLKPYQDGAWDGRQLSGLASGLITSYPYIMQKRPISNELWLHWAEKQREYFERKLSEYVEETRRTKDVEINNSTSGTYNENDGPQVDKSADEKV